MAQLEADLREERERSRSLLDDIALLKGERESNRHLRESVAYLEEQVRAAKDKALQSESQASKHEIRAKEATQARSNLEQQVNFQKERAEEFESLYKAAQRRLEDFGKQSISSTADSLLPEQMMDSIEKLRKENKILR
jgi:chromosome segregation ATPase